MINIPSLSVTLETPPAALQLLFTVCSMVISIGVPVKGWPDLQTVKKARILAVAVSSKDLISLR